MKNGIFVAILLLVLAVPYDAKAVRISIGATPAEPLLHNSFVRDSRGRIVALDSVYARDINAVALNGTYSFMDVLMQQCFGGGFLNDIAGNVPRRTFASAAAWHQPAWNGVANIPFGLENFTRAWRDSIAARPNSGMVNHFNNASVGLPNVVVKDAFSPPGVVDPRRGLLIENPQYDSPDLIANQQLNDLRQFGPEPNSDQYAVLVAWWRANPRHGANIVRMYDTLVNVYNVPAANIAVLYDVPAPANIGPMPFPPDIAALPPVPINALNNRANWLTAVNGGFFAQPPTPGSKLFVYNTGHGSHVDRQRRGMQFDANGDDEFDDLHYRYNLYNGLHTFPVDDTLINPGDLFSLQLSLTELAQSDTRLFINGIDYGLFSSSLLSNDDALDMEALFSGPLYHYRFDVSLADLGVGADSVNIEIWNAPTSNTDYLAVTSFRGGEQEFVIISAIDEPMMWHYLAFMLLIICMRRMSAQTRRPY